ncbi:hypothetical protein [Parasitella parasitica]|uniref:Uncharacterized protein n=1 Tax=Parasitella parasitica TaxID=35722 RepID=A0A0B7NSU0_9FUNG|nr:hypothetical protein [Parasitella parasitica]
MNHITYKHILINIKIGVDVAVVSIIEMHRDSSSSSTASSVESRASDAEQRARGIKRRKVAVSTTAIQGSLCKKCSASGKYNPERPYSSTRSLLCHFHKLNTDEYLAQQLGSPPRRYARKAGMNFAFLEALSNNTHTVFTNVVTEVVDYITELTIKSQIFAAHFILNLLANPPPSPDPGVGFLPIK